MSDKVIYSFNPVGQGLFASGSIKIDNDERKKFSWIYDCGSKEKQVNDIFQAIIRQAKSLCNIDPDLNMLVISHLHKDHFSGIQHLYSSGITNINNIVIPYMPLWQRASLLVAQYDIQKELDEYIRFIIDPIYYLIRTEHLNFENIILIPFFGERNIDMSADDTSGESNDRIDLVSAREMSPLELQEYPLYEGTGTKVYLANGFKVRNKWKILFYNSDSDKFKSFYDDNEKAINDTLLKIRDCAHNTVAVKKSLEDLQQLYRERHGASNNLNDTSVAMYIKELSETTKILAQKSFIRTSCDCSNRKCQSQRWRACRCNNNNYTTNCRIFKSKSSILYTGDINISNPDKMDLLVKYFNLEKNLKNNNLTTLQVMHHGSENNCHPDFPDIVKPIFSVICAGNDAIYKHPSPMLLKYFANYNIQVVNDRGVLFNMTCC